MKRLPLPLSVIKDLQLVINLYSHNLWIANPLKNALRELCDYNYEESIKILEGIQSEYPYVLNFPSCINKIKAAHKRYNNI